MLFFRLMGVVGRMMINPAVNFIKRTLTRNYHPLVESFFYHIGELGYRVKSKVSILAKDVDVHSRPKQLERSKIVEYGAEIFFGKFCITGIGLWLTMREIMKSIEASKKGKESAVKQRNLILEMKEDISNMQTTVAQLAEHAKTTENQLTALQKESTIVRMAHEKRVRELQEQIRKLSDQVLLSSRDKRKPSI